MAFDKHLGTTRSDSTPISHDPHDGAWASNIHQLPVVSAKALSSVQDTGKPYLLVPAEQHAHGLTSALAAASGMDLGEASGLRRDVACHACWVRLCHAFVAEGIWSVLIQKLCMCV